MLTAFTPLLLMGLGLVVLAWWTGLRPAEEAILKDAEQHQQRLVDAASEFVEGRRHLLEILARRPELARGTPESALPILRQEELALKGLFEGLYFDSLDGTVYSAQGKPFSVADRPYFARVLKGLAVNEVLVSRATRRPVLLEVVPVTSNGKLVAALAGTVVLDDFLEKLSAESGLGELKLGLVTPEQVLAGPAIFQQLKGNGRQELATEDGVMLAWSSPVPEVAWRVVVAVPQQALLGRVRNLWLGFVVCAALAFLLAGTMAWRMQQVMVGPIEEITASLGTYQGKGELALPEVGPPELANLAGTLNQMSSRVESETARRVEVEHQLAALAQQESLGRLAGSIAHDFGNLLSGILNLAGLALEEAHGSASKDLETIVTACEQGEALVRQLREYARPQPASEEAFEFDRLLAGWQPNLAALLPDSVEFTLETGAGPARVKTEPNRLFQAVLNLCSNARDAMPEGGKLNLRSSADRETVRLSVSDTGPGVAVENRERIFEPFFTTRAKKGGTGLGLATCKRIITAHGGVIHVEEGPGTTFTVCLPRAE
ncbi:MAG: ATP-binding protein [Vulcanimicrobiota bacterium]